jgi:hypothetical protein
VPFCAPNGFSEFRLTLLERMAGTTRLELATSAVTATYKNAGTARLRVRRTRPHELWGGLWVENLPSQAPLVPGSGDCLMISERSLRVARYCLLS